MSQRRIPVTTLLVLGSAVATFLIPGASDALIFDREAIAQGQWWRVMTGNWVHFTPSHLIYDALAVGVAGALLERKDAATFVLLVMVASLLVGLTVLLGLPSIVRFGGLSGIAYALVTCLALGGLADPGVWRRLCLSTLALLIAKLAFEMATGRFVFVAPGGEAVPVPATHAAGVVAALATWALSRSRRSSNGERSLRAFSVSRLEERGRARRPGGSAAERLRRCFGSREGAPQI